jgi:hypothetical protein
MMIVRASVESFVRLASPDGRECRSSHVITSGLAQRERRPTFSPLSSTTESCLHQQRFAEQLPWCQRGHSPDQQWPVPARWLEAFDILLQRMVCCLLHLSKVSTHIASIQRPHRRLVNRPRPTRMLRSTHRQLNHCTTMVPI